MPLRNFGIVALTICLLFAGCATTIDMPFADNSSARPDPTKAIYLMTVTMRNTYHTSYQPDLIVVNIEHSVVKSKSDRLNFEMDDQGTDETGSPKSGNVYLVRMQLDPGDYVIVGLSCLNRQFPIIANFFAPLHEKLVVTKPGIYYLGHVDATVRERVGNEFKAGPSIPLIDQAVAGASGGTFDIAISDNWVVDQTHFDDKFPGLVGVVVNKQIMAPFDRVFAQKWWEEH